MSILAAEITEDLQSALRTCQAISNDLAQSPEPKREMIQPMSQTSRTRLESNTVFVLSSGSIRG